MSSTASPSDTAPNDLRYRYAYPYFMLHLEEIRTWLEGGCSAKAVWRSYAQRSTSAFPGSYSSFLRYCRKHGLRRPGELQLPRKAPVPNTQRPVSALVSGSSRYPPPLERPAGAITFSEDR